MKVFHHTTGLAGSDNKPLLSICVCIFPLLNNYFAAKYAGAGYYLMIPVDKEAISTPTL